MNEERIKDADALDELRKRVARLVYSYREYGVTDEEWEEIWKRHHDPHVMDHSRQWNMDKIVNDIIVLVRVNVLRGGV